MISHISMCCIYHMASGINQSLPECEDKKSWKLAVYICSFLWFKCEANAPTSLCLLLVVLFWKVTDPLGHRFYVSKIEPWRNALRAIDQSHFYSELCFLIGVCCYSTLLPRQAGGVSLGHAVRVMRKVANTSFFSNPFGDELLFKPNNCTLWIKLALCLWIFSVRIWLRNILR